jgi:hypothetical protein
MFWDIPCRTTATWVGAAGDSVVQSPPLFCDGYRTVLISIIMCLHARYDEADRARSAS